MCEKIYELRDSLKQKSAEILDNLFDPTEKEQGNYKKLKYYRV